MDNLFFILAAYHVSFFIALVANLVNAKLYLDSNKKLKIEHYALGIFSTFVPFINTVFSISVIVYLIALLFYKLCIKIDKRF
jgi:hypothetical protein